MEINEKFLEKLANRIDELKAELNAINKRIERECPDNGMFTGHELTIELVGLANQASGALTETQNLMSWILCN